MSPKGYCSKRAGCSFLNPLSLSALNFFDRGFLSREKLAERSPSTDFKLSCSNLAILSNCSIGMELNFALFWSPAGLFSTGQTECKSDQLLPSSSSSELFELEEDVDESLEDEEDDLFFLFFFLCLFDLDLLDFLELLTWN